MRRTLHRTGFVLAVTALSIGLLPAAGADQYGDARAELVAAYQAGDFERMETAAGQAREARLANTIAPGDRALALVTGRFAQGWADYAGRVGGLAAPVGKAEVAYRHNAGAFVPEGIAIDADGTLYLGSIRSGDIVRLGRGEAAGVATVATAADAGHWSVYGMRLTGDTLWYVSSAVEQFAGLDEADAGRNGLFALDLGSGVAAMQASPVHVPSSTLISS